MLRMRIYNNAGGVLRDDIQIGTLTRQVLGKGITERIIVLNFDTMFEVDSFIDEICFQLSSVDILSGEEVILKLSETEESGFAVHSDVVDVNGVMVYSLRIRIIERR